MFEKLLPGCSHGKTLKSLEVAEFIISENVHPAGSKISEHAHENAHFCFVLQGSYSEFDDRRELICKPSTLTFRPPGEVHVRADPGGCAGSKQRASWRRMVLPCW